MNTLALGIFTCLLVLSLFALLFLYIKRIKHHHTAHMTSIEALIHTLTDHQKQYQQMLQTNVQQCTQQYTLLNVEISRQAQSQTEHLHKYFQTSSADLRQQVQQSLSNQNEHLARLQTNLLQQLNLINGQVEQKLNQGLNKTNELFADMVKRLAIIDQAQQKITQLSSDVVSLQDILSNKQARGHFGEVQLNQLIQNCLPETHYAFQHTLCNGKRVDCIIFLPQPSGNIVIDAKFPLENFRRSINASNPDCSIYKQKFKQDVKHHIKAIADKYVGIEHHHQAALMFLPAEALFAEIHAHHTDLIDFAFSQKVWLVSPTTMMAILHTVQATLKDVQTQKQMHLIQEHLVKLSQDFNRFQQRMNTVAKHISDAHDKVGQVNISANKIVKHFQHIERCELSADIQKHDLNISHLET
ncbi:MAG: DNA recombination protein RmuC [Pseudomonadota bacterium]|nr:DNA recombination protein RmuC [Pseudomonadota bacterium]